MESAADLDIEKEVAVEPTEVHANTDNSTDRDVEGERPHPATSVGKLGYWGLEMEAIWGVEARGITRVMDHEKNVARPLHDYFHMFSLWFSINLQAVNIIIGLLGGSQILQWQWLLEHVGVQNYPFRKGSTQVRLATQENLAAECEGTNATAHDSHWEGLDSNPS
jgi:hypothetical protein